MAWTYSQIPTTDRDKVRFLCGDIDIHNQLVQDEEIAFALEYASSPPMAAAMVCESLASRFASQVDETVGPLSRTLSQRSAQFADRAKRLRDLDANVSRSSAEMFIGGISKSVAQKLAMDTSAKQPTFSIGQDDNPEAGSDPRGSGADG